jgi:replication-associated recombination protein RarA
MDIFDYHAQKAAESTKPLAERMRPRNISEFVGQDHVVSR